MNLFEKLGGAINKKFIAQFDKIDARLEAAESPDPKIGYAIYGRGRDQFAYVEAGRKLEFYAELLTGKINRALEAKSIRHWNPPHENEPLSDEEKARILKNICDYFDRAGITYQVYED